MVVIGKPTHRMGSITSLQLRYKIMKIYMYIVCLKQSLIYASKLA